MHDALCLLISRPRHLRTVVSFRASRNSSWQWRGRWILSLLRQLPWTKRQRSRMSRKRTLWKNSWWHMHVIGKSILFPFNSISSTLTVYIYKPGEADLGEWNKSEYLEVHEFLFSGFYAAYVSFGNTSFKYKTSALLENGICCSCGSKHSCYAA